MMPNLTLLVNCKYFLCSFVQKSYVLGGYSDFLNKNLTRALLNYAINDESHEHLYTVYTPQLLRGAGR